MGTNGMRELTPAQEAFAGAVASGKTQAEAYRQAYPKSLKWKDKTVWSRASELMAKSEVSGRVKELVKLAAERNEVTVERVLKEIARIAFFDVRKLADPSGNALAIHELDDDTAAAIQGLDVAIERGRPGDDGEEPNVTTVRKYKVADKNSALEKLGKYLSMFTDNVNLRNPDGSMQPTVIKITAKK